jgi:hypothetical protein
MDDGAYFEQLDDTLHLGLSNMVRLDTEWTIQFLPSNIVQLDAQQNMLFHGETGGEDDTHSILSLKKKTRR